MKKGLLLVLLILCRIPGFSQLFVSNASGMKLDEIDAEMREQFTWVLEISDEEEGIENRVLFKNGEEKKRWILTYDRKTLLSERVILNGLDSEFIEYRPDGRILNTVIYDEEGQFKESLSYSYQDKTLSYIESSNNQGESLYRDIYSIRDDGSLRRIIRLRDEDYFVMGWRHNAGFTKRGSNFEISFYCSDGLPERIELWNGTLLEERTEITRFEEGGSLRKWSSFLTDQSIISRRNGLGLLISEETFRDDILASTTVYSYDEQNRLIRRDFNGLGKKEHFEFTYKESEEDEDDDSRIQREDYYIDGVLHSRKNYTEPGKERHDYYRQGELFLQVFYEEQQIVKEVLVKDGEITRERIRE